jgi:serine/threonine-protein kinase HipA
MKACRGCLSPLCGDASWHSSCLRALFGSNVSDVPEIFVEPSELHRLGQQMAGRTTISGVQKKLSLGWNQRSLRVVASRSSFILKPQVEAWPRLPENEHLTMCLAKAFGLHMPAFGLVQLSNGAEAFIIRRFDRIGHGQRLPCEDFCQLSGLSPADKYEGSAEHCVKIINRFCNAPKIQLFDLYRRLLFSWWAGNGDLHLKNLSLLSFKLRENNLSPNYDLVNTQLYLPNDELALPVAGKRSNLKRATWLEFANYCKLPSKLACSELDNLLLFEKEAREIIHHSFLTDEAKEMYWNGLKAKRHWLNHF